jgi:hypothetical protein
MNREWAETVAGIALTDEEVIEINREYCDWLETVASIDAKIAENELLDSLP